MFHILGSHPISWLRELEAGPDPRAASAQTACPSALGVGLKAHWGRDTSAVILPSVLLTQMFYTVILRTLFSVYLLCIVCRKRVGVHGCYTVAYIKVTGRFSGVAFLLPCCRSVDKTQVGRFGSKSLLYLPSHLLGPLACLAKVCCFVL